MNQKVSVIMSAYNSETTIRKSIESVLNQTYKNIELLVMDDGSTDNTYYELNKINDERLLIFRNKNNLGLTKSLNILIEKSSGVFIARQDADDYSHKNRILRQVQEFNKKNIDICVTRAKTIQNNKKIPGLSFFLPYKVVLKYKNPFVHGTIMINKSSLLKVGKYDEKFYFAQDYKLYFDLAKANFKFKKIFSVLYYLNTLNNISTNYYEEQLKFANLIKNYRKI